MLRLSRSTRRRIFRPRFILLVALFLLFIDYTRVAVPQPKRISPNSPNAPSPQKIFIASINRNSEYILRLYWNGALISLIQHLGPSNVFVSIVESGSQEDTKGALYDLKAKLDELGVGNKIDLGIDVWQQTEELLKKPDEGKREGWIFTGRSESGWEVRRIPYLAKLRNKAMEPLLALSPGRIFEKVIWINDVVFTVSLLFLSSK
jgi:hypothetical protein